MVEAERVDEFAKQRSSKHGLGGGYRIYSITVRQMISGELLKQRKEFFIHRGYETGRGGSSLAALTLPPDLSRHRV